MNETNPVLLMAIYSAALALTSAAAGFSLGRWLGDREGRLEAQQDEQLRAVLAKQTKNEQRSYLLIAGPEQGPN
jgi:hypothetical protein